MIKNYLKTAWRSLIKNRIYSVISIAGLSVGLAVCMLVLLYVEHEHSYDRFHANAPRIFRIEVKSVWGHDTLQTPKVSYPVAPYIKRAFPGVADYVRISTPFPAPVTQLSGNAVTRVVQPGFIYADENFFRFFSFPLLKGNAATVLAKPYTVVITREMAERYFGRKDPVGETIRVDGKYSFVVSGVAENPPSNSTVKFSFVASLSSYSGMEEQLPDIHNERIQGGSFLSYILLHPSASAIRLEQALRDQLRASDPKSESPQDFCFLPLTSLHLANNYNTGSNLRYLSLFPLVALLVLILAITNYVSLFTAMAGVRSKEIGIRKVMGAARKAIAAQFFLESVLFTFISFLIGYFLCFIFHGSFFRFLELPVDQTFLFNGTLLCSYLLLFFFTLLLASFYPAILLSAFKPVQVLYSKFTGSPRGLTLRKFFTVFQFSVAVMLLMCGMVIKSQISFFKNAYTGVNRDNVLMIPYPANMEKQLIPLRSEINALPGIRETAIDHYQLYGNGIDEWFVRSEENTQGIALGVHNVDEHFIPMLGLRWENQPADSLFYLKEHQVVLNEAAMKALHLNPSKLNQGISFGGNKVFVAGVLKDFNYNSLEFAIGPMALTVKPGNDADWKSMQGCILAKVNAHVNLPGLLERVKAIYEQYDQTTTFSYTFMDDAFANLYRAEEKLSQLFFAFIALTISLAVIGLFGLVTFMTSQRVKEIGIRKVLGASVSQIVHLLTREFIRLILLAWIISCPVAWYFMNHWLESFAYRITIAWWIPVVAGAVTLLIAVLTMGFQSVKTALANPAGSLRSE